MRCGAAADVENALNDFLTSHFDYKNEINITPLPSGEFSVVVAYRPAAYSELSSFRQLIERPPFCRQGCPHCKPDAFVGGTCALSGEHNGQFKRMCEVGLVAYVKNGGGRE